jgi:hypothetical protein
MRKLVVSSLLILGMLLPNQAEAHIARGTYGRVINSYSPTTGLVEGTVRIRNLTYRRRTIRCEVTVTYGPETRSPSVTATVPARISRVRDFQASFATGGQAYPHSAWVSHCHRA